MAVNIGPRIGIDGESEYRKQISNIIQDTKTLSSEMKKLESAYDKTGNEQQKATEKSKLLVRAIDDQKEKIKLLGEMVEKSAAKYGETDAKTLKWRQALADAETQLNKLNDELKNNTSLKVWADGIEKSSEKLKTVGQNIQNVGSTLTQRVTLPLAGAAAAAAKVAIDFESGMSKVAAISGATGDDLDSLTDKAKEMGATTKFSARESADAFSYMALAGWKTEDMLAGIEPTMNLAAASGEDLARVSDIVTDDLTAFGKSAKDAGRFTDILASTTANSNTNVEMLGQAFEYAAPLAGALGFSMEDMAVATGLMANAGIKGSRAGTALRSTLTRLTKPTAESAGAMEALNLTVEESDGSMRPLIEIIKDLREGFNGMSESEQASTAAALAGQEAMSGLLAVVNASDDDFAKLTESIYESEGAAKRMADTMIDNTGGALTKMKSALEGAGIAIGENFAPHITAAADAIAGLAEKFGQLDEETQKTIIKVGAFAAALGPSLTVIGKVTSGIGDIGKVAGEIAGKLASAATAQQAYAEATGLASIQQNLLNTALLANPAALTVAGIGAILGLAYVLDRTFNGVREHVDTTYDIIGRLRDKAKDATKAIKDNLTNLDTNFDDATASIEGQSKQTDALINELSRLEQQTSLTSDEQRRMQSVVDELNGLYPDLGLEIDEVTGKLNKSSEEVRMYTDKMAEMAKMDAYFEIVKQGYTNLAEAQKNLADAEAERAQLQERQKILQAQLSQINQEAATSLDAEADARHNLNGVLYDTDTALGMVQGELLENQHAQEEALSVINDLKDGVYDAAEQVNRYSDAYETAKERTYEYSTALDENAQAEQKAQEETERLTSTTEAYIRQVEAAKVAHTDLADTGRRSFENLTASQQSAAIAFADSVNQLTQSTIDAVNSQMDMFAEFQKGSDISTDTLLKNMQSQITGIKDWERDMTTLADRGINQNLLQYLADMGPQGSNYVRAFSEMSDEELKKANALWEKSLDVKGLTDKWGQNFLDSGIENIKKGFRGIRTATKLSGEETARGLAEGILDYAYTSEDAAKEMGLEVSAAVNRALDIHSPSGVMMRAGRYVSEGLAMGIEQGQSRVVGAAVHTARAAIEAAERALGIHSPSKVFYGLGDNTVQGYVNALEDNRKNVMESMVDTFEIPAYTGPAQNNNSISYGGTVINVYGSDGQSVEELADIVQDRINSQIHSMRQAWA